MTHTTNKNFNNILLFLESISESAKKISETLANNTLENRETMTREQIAKEFYCSEERVADWHNLGMLKGVRTGKNYVYLREDVKAFFNKYRGYDVSNYLKAKESKEAYKKYENTHIDTWM